MLVEFRVKNFRSLREEQVFSLVASHDTSLPRNALSSDALSNRRILRSAILYGANASGKSNIVKALEFVARFVEGSVERRARTDALLQPFRLDETTEKEPSKFEVTFIRKNVRYQYGFSLDHHRVHEEWLIAYPKGFPQTWFKRTATSDPEVYEWYYGSQLKGERKTIEALTRPDALFLTVAAQYNHKQLTDVYKWFAHELRVIDMSSNSSFFERMTAERFQQNAKFRQAVIAIVQVADLGIIDVSVEKTTELPMDIPEELRALITKGSAQWAGLYDIKMYHNTKNRDGGIPFSFRDESLGTRRLFSMIGPWIQTLVSGCVLIVDEIDASLHPTLVRVLVELFHNPEVNIKGAQLIFNTHDISLLDNNLFRRDQIWFIEKDNAGASHLYPLLEFSPRKNEALAKGYLQGRYGAVPFIGELPDVISVGEENLYVEA